MQKHEVPISAIPCLQYRKELEKENEQKQINNNNQKSVNEQDNIITTTSDMNKSNCLSCL